MPLSSTSGLKTSKPARTSAILTKYSPYSPACRRLRSAQVFMRQPWFYDGAGWVGHRIVVRDSPMLRHTPLTTPDRRSTKVSACAAAATTRAIPHGLAKVPLDTLDEKTLATSRPCRSPLDYLAANLDAGYEGLEGGQSHRAAHYCSPATRTSGLVPARRYRAA